MAQQTVNLSSRWFDSNPFLQKFKGETMELNEAGLHEETLHKVCEAICGLGGIDYTTCFPDIVAHIKATVPVSLDWDRDTGNGFSAASLVWIVSWDAPAEKL